MLPTNRIAQLPGFRGTMEISNKRRKPVQRRSRERVEKILIAAADELARSSLPEDMTTTLVAKRSGVPVATIYRYFTDRSDIIAALIDQEMAEIDEQINARIAKLETVTMDSALRLVMNTHFEHFLGARRSVVLWFGARKSRKVLERVNRRYAYMGDWIQQGGINCGFVGEEIPVWGGEAIIWLCDRTFEFIFRAERSEAEQQEILEMAYWTMLAGMERFSAGGPQKSVTGDEFRSGFGEFKPPENSPDD
jgi:AcrR family transcriptional regulator